MSFLWLLVWLSLSIAVAIYADRRGRNGIGFLFLALILSPIVAFAFAALAPDEAIAKQRQLGKAARRCPFCAEAIQLEAIVCKHCGRDLKTPRVAKYAFRCKTCGEQSVDSTSALAHAATTHRLRGEDCDRSIEPVSASA